MSSFHSSGLSGNTTEGGKKKMTKYVLSCVLASVLLNHSMAHPPPPSVKSMRQFFSKFYGSRRKVSRFLAHESVSHVQEINWEKLHAMGVRGAVIDKDNTLNEPGCEKVVHDTSTLFQTQ